MKIVKSNAYFCWAGNELEKRIRINKLFSQSKRCSTFRPQCNHKLTCSSKQTSEHNMLSMKLGFEWNIYVIIRYYGIFLVVYAIVYVIHRIVVPRNGRRRIRPEQVCDHGQSPPTPAPAPHSCDSVPDLMSQARTLEEMYYMIRYCNYAPTHSQIHLMLTNADCTVAMTEYLLDHYASHLNHLPSNFFCKILQNLEMTSLISSSMKQRMELIRDRVMNSSSEPRYFYNDNGIHLIHVLEHNLRCIRDLFSCTPTRHSRHESAIVN